ncbi:hypothetical protein KFE25_006942 [Diacronema lutheri]|uniref:Major facilitator superfamily (MFS) profile domain-containing protein n=1 Tax=Diacronema lutheri TaxID=2081491 RepID=A0A8J5XYM5_DIALT|nr:hypothetical protein KFE25_006942 [Diacronema lutheri]
MATAAVIVACSLFVSPGGLRARSLRVGCARGPRRALPSIRADAAASRDVDDTTAARLLRPLQRCAFVLMLGEGVAISTIPLHLARYGATPIQIGSATSAFSVAQMLCCPLVVAASSRLGRARVLRACLAGATAAGLVIALSSTTNGVILGRLLGGVFAASVPVSQAAVAEIMPQGREASQALARLSAAANSGVVLGPALAAVLQGLFARLGLAADLCVRAAFVASALVALAVLALDGAACARLNAAPPAPPPSASSPGAPARGAVRRRLLPARAQLLLRTVALGVGWSLTLSVSTYSLFAYRMLGWAQPQLSAMLSAGAAVTVGAQLLLVPRLLAAWGERRTCAVGLVCVSAGLCGLSRVVSQPFHHCFYFLNRVGSGIADTSTAALVVQASGSRDERSHNLAMVQSTRAGARIVTPLISGALFQRSASTLVAPGALPYTVAASLMFALAPVPLAIGVRAAPPPPPLDESA